MTSQSSTEHAWTCPVCSRQVPPRIDTCRCGHVREPMPASGGAEGAPSWRIPPAAWVIGIAVVVLAFWMGYSARRASPVSEHPAEPVSPSADGRQPAGHASGRRAACQALKPPPPLKFPPPHPPRRPRPSCRSRLLQRPRQPGSRTSPTGPSGRSSGSRPGATRGADSSSRQTPSSPTPMSCRARGASPSAGSTAARAPPTSPPPHPRSTWPCSVS